MKRLIQLFAVLALLCATAIPSVADVWKVSDDVNYYQSGGKDHEFVGSALASAATNDRYKTIWQRVEEKLEKADSFIIMTTVAYSNTPVVRAIYRTDRWQMIDSGREGIFELPVGQAMAEELTSRVDMQDQIDLSYLPNHPTFTYLTARVRGKTIRHAFSDSKGAGDQGSTAVHAKLYFLARSVGGLVFPSLEGIR
jgi:hypothetical protein